MKHLQHEQERIAHPLMEYYRHVFQDSPLWNGVDDMAEKRIIVYMEQGYGDCIQFLRYLSVLRNSRNAKNCHIIVMAPPELERLIKNGVTGWNEYHPKNDPSLPPHDAHVLSMSLPFLLSDELSSKGAAHTSFPYIASRLPPKDLSGVDGFKLGICWEGSPNHRTNSLRSIPLAWFAKLQQEWKNKKPLRLFCLQKEMHNPDLIKDCEDLELLGTDIEDFQDTASLIGSLDAVATVDTSILHLAGAMNKKTFLLLSNSAADGRFGEFGTTTRWYSSVTVVRKNDKSHALDWSEAFDFLNTSLSS